MLMQRLISGLMLAAVVVAGQALAMARAENPANMAAVLCTGMGTQVIYLDAEGNPVSAPHLCPDGVAAMVAGFAPAPAAVLPEQRLVALVVSAPAVPKARLLRRVFEARGPPMV
ncbi:hypothetical protein [Vannielia sp.]|uniref:hypothetical protein n=1 Tax=Vannielia sp. TaxID=2813045 RepID=UPI002636E764|nr:hypothetical protein [Vannielia sp.]